MKRQTMVLVVLMVLVAAASATAQAWFWGRTAIVASGALFMQDRTYSERYHVLYVADLENDKTCMMVLRDAVTQQFSAVAVDPGSCRR